MGSNVLARARALDMASVQASTSGAARPSATVARPAAGRARPRAEGDAARPSPRSEGGAARPPPADAPRAEGNA